MPLNLDHYIHSDINRYEKSYKYLFQDLPGRTPQTLANLIHEFFNVVANAYRNPQQKNQYKLNNKREEIKLLKYLDFYHSAAEQTRSAIYDSAILKNISVILRKKTRLEIDSWKHSITLLFTHMASHTTLQTDTISIALCSLSKLADINVCLIENIHPEAIANVFHLFADNRFSASMENITNTLLAIAKLIKTIPSLKIKIKTQAILDAFNTLGNNAHANAQDKTTALLAMAKLVAVYPEELKPNAVVIADIFHTFAHDPTSNAQEKSNALWALGNLAEVDYTLIQKIHPKAIADVFHSLALLRNANARDQASALLAMEKLEQANSQLIRDTNPKAIVDVFHTFADQEKSNPQNKANALCAISRLVEANHTVIDLIDPKAIAKIVHRFAENRYDANDQNKANTLFALSKFATINNRLIQEINPKAITDIFDILANDINIIMEQKAKIFWDVMAISYFYVDPNARDLLYQHLCEHFSSLPPITIKEHGQVLCSEVAQVATYLNINHSATIEWRNAKQPPSQKSIIPSDFLSSLDSQCSTCGYTFLTNKPYAGLFIDIFLEPINQPTNGSIAIKAINQNDFYEHSFSDSSSENLLPLHHLRRTIIERNGDCRLLFMPVKDSTDFSNPEKPANAILKFNDISEEYIIKAVTSLFSRESQRALGTQQRVRERSRSPVSPSRLDAERFLSSILSSRARSPESAGLGDYQQKRNRTIHSYESNQSPTSPRQ